ncbi:MAG: NAD-dependent epimerase/dehydratase family protein [Mucilaginibacter polytrichastri]|nr:NAD-dependent epimerase/dehydratase family protein [Mucilaginibacter polytrichastri]
MRGVITGASGFVGKNLQQYLSYKKIDFTQINLRENDVLTEIEKPDEFVVHLAGKAHDLKQTASSGEYYKVNTELTQKVFDAFLASEAHTFITISSVKAVADSVTDELAEDALPDPKTHYGKSKLLGEQYILTQKLPEGKRVYILRPCMIHGPGNKGNLNLLFSIVKKGLPWPLASFSNKRSFLTVENLCFVIHELLKRSDIPSGIYHVADNNALSTNELINLISQTLGLTPRLWKFPRPIVALVARAGSVLHLPLNSERLQKLTESYVVNTEKLLKVLKKPLPVSAEDGLRKTIQSFAE